MGKDRYVPAQNFKAGLTLNCLVIEISKTKVQVSVHKEKSILRCEQPLVPNISNVISTKNN